MRSALEFLLITSYYAVICPVSNSKFDPSCHLAAKLKIKSKDVIMRKFLAIAAISALSLTAPLVVHAQSQWVLISTIEDGNRIYFDTTSQVRIFDTGIKQNTFRTVTTSPNGVSLRGIRYQADCFKGTLALRAIERVNRNGALIQTIPLESADKIPATPVQGSVGEDILRYACSQF